MESIRGFIATWLVLLLVCLGSPARAESLIFAPLPMQSLAQTQASNQPLTDLLAELLDRPVEMRLYPDHAALLDGLTRGEVDLVELGPLPLLLAKERMSRLNEVASFREPDGRADYRCVVVAPVDGIQSLAEIERKPGQSPVAMTRPESTCGPTVTFSLLADQGLDPNQLRGQYRGTHDDVALAVLRELHPLGVIKESVARRFFDLGLRILASSDPVPGFVLVSPAGKLAEQELGHLREALMALDSRQLSRLQNGRYGFVRFDEQLGYRLEAMRVFSAPYFENVAP
ncbi:MAG: PhnD/SsuA/transferrin family substrate-binding protein [Wenzhouxiangella sp.]|jgi:phosphonate transport system substrate-binding protein|nr:PhnD/SsuA/transferrin family substrate-binding protein [Wenzhouxiangella sp.]